MSRPPIAAAAATAPSPYPFAAAPDIVRAHQKDAYFTSHLADVLTDLHRRLFGARSAHALAPDLRSLAGLAYFCLTTLPGNRTLGEEYCDLVQVESPHARLPGVYKRAAYIVGSVLLPFLAGKALPPLRKRLRDLVQRRLDTLRRRGGRQESSGEARAWQYLLDHVSSLTSAAPVQALALALFYFSGTYYDLTKRLLSLRYVFTREVPTSPERSGYEVLGVLLVIQLAVQGYLHVRSVVRRHSQGRAPAAVDTSRGDPLVPDMGVRRDSQQGRVDTAPSTTREPVGARPRFDLSDAKLMAYIKSGQQRNCTLCLEELKDPSATLCGHVFCWECIGDWAKEKPECPLCRREVMMQHVLPLTVL